MDCKFINQNDIHEKYLLDRLNENEKSDYLSHLNSCGSCKSKLESEKELLGSIRHFGKSEMKSEISKQVAELKSTQKDVSWDMILKVAAIFFFLVITPGLVYYYQSVEPPKISELYDFDEVVKKQKESKKTEAEEDSDVIDTEPGQRKIEIKETTSDLLKSASGAGTQPSVQSIGLSEPAKKTIPHINAPAEIAAEDDSDFEAEQPVSPSVKSATRSVSIAKNLKKSEKTKMGKSEQSLDDIMSFKADQPKAVPKSNIPELEKFQKPVFSSVGGQEINRAKVLSSEKLGTTSRSMYNQAKSEQMAADKIASTGESKSNQISTNDLSKDKIIKLDYKINSQTVIVNLVPLLNDTEFYLKQSLPDSFPVIKVKNLSLDLMMDWFINERIRNVDPAGISIYFGENNHLYVNIQNTKFYQIDLKSDSTKAVTIQ